MKLYSQERRLQLFQNFDMFGVPICIRFNSNETHKTSFGAIITLAIIIVLIIQFGEVLNDVFTYANFSVIFQENIVEVPSRFEVKPQNFSFAFGLQDAKLNQILDESIYTIEATYRDSYKVFNATSNQYDIKTDEYPFKVEPCTPEHFKVAGAIEYFLKLPYKKLYCLPIKEKIVLEGQFGSQAYRRFRLKIKYCSGTKCQALEKIQSAIGYCNLQIYYVNYAVQVIDRQNPFKGIGQNTFWQSGYSIMKNINMYFRNTYVDSDEGYIMSSVQKHQNLLYSFDREQLATQVDNIMFDVYVNLEKNKESQYIRKYQKLHQGLSQLGGLFNFLFFVGSIVCFPFSRLLLSQKLLNSVFDFKEKENQLLSLVASQSKEQMLTSPQLNTVNSKVQIKSRMFKSKLKQSDGVDSDIQLSNLQAKTDEFLNLKSSQRRSPRQRISSQFNKDEYLFTKEDQTLENNQTEGQQSKSKEISQVKALTFSPPSPLLSPNQNKQIDFSNQDQVLCNENSFSNKINQFSIKICDIIKGTFSQKCQHLFKYQQSEKSQMINYAFEKLNNQLDIYRIIIKLQELDKLKLLLLNKDQIKLFEYIPQPVLNLDKFRKLSSNKQKCEQQFGIFHDDNKNPLEKAQEALDAYHRIFNLRDKSSISSIDKKLLKLIDPYQLNESDNYKQNLLASKYQDSQTFTLQADSRLLKSKNYDELEKTEFGHKRNTTCNKDSELLGENLIFLDK